MKVARNWVDSQVRDVPWPAHEVESADEPTEEGQVMGKFWAHDAAALEEMDKRALQEALDGDSEIGRLEKMMATDFEAFHRSGGSDRLMQLKTRGK